MNGTAKASQRKGRAGEIELAHILQAHGYNVEPGRSQSFGEVPDLSGLPGVHIECKRVERLNISQAMAQAVRDAERFQDGAPAVFHRRNREPWLVTMRLEDWLDIWGTSQSPEKGEKLQKKAHKKERKIQTTGNAPLSNSV